MRSSSPRPISLNPTAIMPAWTASAMASVAFFRSGPSPVGSDVAIKSESEPALSGLPVVVSATMLKLGAAACEFVQWAFESR